jgi:hypothetical protein
VSAIDLPAARRQLAVLSEALSSLREDAVGVMPFSTLARNQVDLLAALPARYADVLHQLLDRLESSALFSEESCSFSQKDLLDNLQMWLDKADGTLGRHPDAPPPMR